MRSRRDKIGISTVVLCIYVGIKRKEIFSFHFQFQFNLTSNGIKVENMSKSNCMQKLL